MAKNISFDSLDFARVVEESAGLDMAGNAVTLATVRTVSPSQLERHYDEYFAFATGAAKTKVLKVIDDEKIRKGLK